MRGDIWFLAQLFVQPEVHSLGIGGALLAPSESVRRDANGARVFSVVSTAQPVSQSLYMRHGMFAIGIGYRMTGELEPLRQLPDPDATKKTIVDCGRWQDSIAKLDRDVVRGGAAAGPCVVPRRWRIGGDPGELRADARRRTRRLRVRG